MFTSEKLQKISESCLNTVQQLDLVDPVDLDDFKETSEKTLMTEVLGLVPSSRRLNLLLDMVKKELLTQDDVQAEVELAPQEDCDHVDKVHDTKFLADMADRLIDTLPKFVETHAALRQDYLQYQKSLAQQTEYYALYRAEVETMLGQMQQKLGESQQLSQDHQGMLMQVGEAEKAAREKQDKDFQANLKKREELVAEVALFCDSVGIAKMKQRISELE